jgi:plasmid stabilization system protein ParE
VKRHAVVWAAMARADLEEIASFIADDSPINALRVVERLERRALTLTTMPTRGRIVPELRWHGIVTFLEMIERPWRVVYRIDDATVYVVAVLDGRRNLEDLLLARFLRQE